MTADPRIEVIASIITDLWPHRQSRKAAEQIVGYVDRLAIDDNAPYAYRRTPLPTHEGYIPKHRKGEW